MGTVSNQVKYLLGFRTATEALELIPLTNLLVRLASCPPSGLTAYRLL